MKALAAKYVVRGPLGLETSESYDIVGCSLPALIQLLTGATGSLGAHLVHELCRTTSGNVVCLVRASDDTLARQRVLHALHAKELEVDQSRLVAIAADTSENQFGLKEDHYRALLRRIAVVIHVGERRSS